HIIVRPTPRDLPAFVIPSYAVMLLACFFCTDTATTEIYTLSLHDALPIFGAIGRVMFKGPRQLDELNQRINSLENEVAFYKRERSEEHTSELQSRENLVCRLLLEKKKKDTRREHTNNASSSAQSFFTRSNN